MKFQISVDLPEKGRAAQALLILLASLTGCATGGLPFTGIEAPPPDKAVIYVYRPTAFAQAINRFSVDLEGHMAMPVELKNGTWARLVVTPGRQRLNSTGQVMTLFCSPLSLDAAAGEVKFVELTVSMRGDGQGRTIQDCKLSTVAQASALQKISATGRAVP